MGIASSRTVANKERYRRLIDAYAAADAGTLREQVADFHATNATLNVVQPINSVVGVDGYLACFFDPLYRSFRHLHRRADMVFGGEHEGHEWVVSHGHYVGEFVTDWLGIPASNEIVWLHYLEFHRIDDGESVESYLYVDMPDLLRQLGRWPLPPSLGFEGFVPGPATADGMVVGASNPQESRTSLRMVDDMLARLYTDDERWRPYWHKNMYWYGPSGYGSFIGIDGFARFQLPYESIFEKGRARTTYIRSGDKKLDEAVRGHYARIADGNYVASGGWPSHGGFMASDWLGVQATGQMFTVRVADIWRRQGDLLVENWVFVDIVDMLLQLGVDLFEKAGIDIQLEH